MTGYHDDLLKQIAKMIALESHETKPVIHININLDKCWQLFEGENDAQESHASEAVRVRGMSIMPLLWISRVETGKT